MFTKRLFGLAVLLAIGLVGCGPGATPQLIGSYPKSVSPTYAPPPSDALVIYEAYLTLEVSNTDQAAQRAIEFAYDRGGYLVNSQSWYENSRKYTTLTLTVPVAQFESLRQALLGLGSAINETVSSDLVSTSHGANEWNTFTNITVQLRPAPSITLPSLPSTGWNPTHTFERAFDVFASIFTFLVDIVIWVVVIVGPFVLMGLGVRAVVRRMRR